MKIPLGIRKSISTWPSVSLTSLATSSSGKTTIGGILTSRLGWLPVPSTQSVRFNSYKMHKITIENSSRKFRVSSQINFLQQACQLLWFNRKIWLDLHQRSHFTNRAFGWRNSYHNHSVFISFILTDTYFLIVVYFLNVFLPLWYGSRARRKKNRTSFLKFLYI